LVIAAGGVRERFRPEARLFAEQPWTYADVILAFAVLTGTAFLAPSAGALGVPSEREPGCRVLASGSSHHGNDLLAPSV
jgi:hypothetical protein